MVDNEMIEARVEQEREEFNVIDHDNSGFIERWEFNPYMAIRYLSRRQPMEIVNMLTPHEVDYLRSYFKRVDTSNRGAISQVCFTSTLAIFLSEFPSIHSLFV